MQETPNPNSFKFIVDRSVLGQGAASLEFANITSASESPLAIELFKVAGVKGVFLGADFITVTKDDDEVEWQDIKPAIYDTIKNFFKTAEPVVSGSLSMQKTDDLSSSAGDDDIVTMIKELIETRIRPTVLDDGGDIVFKGFENGIVKVKLMGSCSSCPSSVVTLKRGVENMLQFYVPEVQGVLEVEDEIDDISKKEFDKLQKTLEEKEKDS